MITKGNVIVENIKIGDIHYEYELGHEIKVVVITLPEKTTSLDNKIQYTWKSKIIDTERVIEYLITEGLEHYGPNLYDYQAYKKI